MIKDLFERVHDYLRISLTDNCNLRCAYCMPADEYDFTPASQLMQTSEVETISRLFVEQGVKKIRLTGGEPLVRRDAASIIESLGSLPIELVITTNGTRLHEFLSVLRSANIRTINISLDTLQPDKFMLITRRNLFHLALRTPGGRSSRAALVLGIARVHSRAALIRSSRNNIVCYSDQSRPPCHSSTKFRKISPRP